MPEDTRTSTPYAKFNPLGFCCCGACKDGEPPQRVQATLTGISLPPDMPAEDPDDDDRKFVCIPGNEQEPCRYAYEDEENGNDQPDCEGVFGDVQVLDLVDCLKIWEPWNLFPDAENPADWEIHRPAADGMWMAIWQLRQDIEHCHFDEMLAQFVVGYGTGDTGWVGTAVQAFWTYELYLLRDGEPDLNGAIRMNGWFTDPVAEFERSPCTSIDVRRVFINANRRFACCDFAVGAELHVKGLDDPDE